MEERRLSTRLRRLPRRTVLGCEVPVAPGFRGRLLGLALLGRDRAGTGLLIPRCSSVHTFGMRFPLDLVFLDGAGRAIEIHFRVKRRRIVSCPGAGAVLELPSPEEKALTCFVTNLVGEEREPADSRLQGVGEANEGGVAWIANAPLEAADVRQVNP
jgi:uncharacterized membrane protein (UPF0127 family)